MSYTFDDVSLYSKKKLKYEHIPEGFMITIEDINKVIEKIKIRTYTGGFYDYNRRY